MSIIFSRPKPRGSTRRRQPRSDLSTRRRNEGWVYARQQEQDLFHEGFRKLGLPICATDEYLAKIVNPTRLLECVKAYTKSR
jgi:hypothetical protein